MGWRTFSGKRSRWLRNCPGCSGIVAAALLYLIASGKTGFDAAASGFASNGYGEHSPGGYSMLSALVVELVLSAGFLLVIHWRNRQIRSGRFCADRYWSGLNPDSLNQYSGD